MEYISKCECGRCSAKIVLSQSLENYEARACQCEFCLPRNAAYLSVPLGNVTLSPASNLNAVTQGSGVWLAFGSILKLPQGAGFRALSSVSIQGKERSGMTNPFQVL
ncbi:hypothetical protein [Vibrio penaeicida]|uniref:CENP-V/GFA domain-containing protein n=1 Tax=Vibrio penaeicida TaxID=104609 RepID=A0AAV5NUQ9_9VIBR|nr:hypothetical protein [Vibrio penaeicida]RTZ24113.1 hypothetical protein EKN09_05390 [Vibrio penaeicida]GLQ74014.1 hypothetical protein GCM10007932_33740 [Vibrio penaeicida]